MRVINTVRAQIYGREYVFDTEAEPERLEDLCAVLDARMRKLADTTGYVDSLKLAVLAALSIANDARSAREEMMKLNETISERSIACVSMLDLSIS